MRAGAGEATQVVALRASFAIWRFCGILFEPELTFCR